MLIDGIKLKEADLTYSHDCGRGSMSMLDFQIDLSIIHL